MKKEIEKPKGIHPLYLRILDAMDEKIKGIADSQWAPEYVKSLVEFGEIIISEIPKNESHVDYIITRLIRMRMILKNKNHKESKQTRKKLFKILRKAGMKLKHLY